MTEKRMRSPSYPSTPLREAIDLVEKMFRQARTRPQDREVAVQAMGYSGMTGRSAKVLSDLIQYGLLQKAGKNEVEVTELAVSILHPDGEGERAESIRQAFENPELFRELEERFPGTDVEESVLRSYLVRRGFTDAALNLAVRAYGSTKEFLLDQPTYGTPSGNIAGDDGSEAEGRDPRSRSVDSGGKSAAGRLASDARASAAPSSGGTGERTRSAVPAAVEPTFNMVGRSRILLGGVVSSKEDADRVIAFMSAVKSLLDDRHPDVEDASSDGGEDTLSEG